MGGTAYGKWQSFCANSGNRYATIPVCNLFKESPARSGPSAPGFGVGACDLLGISLSKHRHVANLGSILFCGVALVLAAFLLWRSNMKKAAVGRREMQLFLLGYFIIEICEIFTVGGFPLDGAVRRGISAVHIAAVVTTCWILMLNGVVGYQILEDGTPISLGLVLFSSLLIFVGTGYVALDTGFSWTGFWDSTLVAPNQAYALYTLYQLVPIVFLVVYYLLEAFLVLRVLGERRPMFYLTGAALLFIIGQIFQYVISEHICRSTSGAINGGMFETFFTLLAVAMVWVFWSSITEDDWPVPTTGGGYT